MEACELLSFIELHSTINNKHHQITLTEQPGLSPSAGIPLLCRQLIISGMRISIVYDKAKVLQALRYHFISRREVKLLLILVNVFALISAGLFAFKVIRPFPFLVSSLLWFLLMLTFWFWLPRLIYKRSSTFTDEIDLTFRGDDILLETSRGYTTWGYKRFAYYMESPYFFHLYINDKSFFLIPKDACTGDADSIEVRKLLQEKIGKK